MLLHLLINSKKQGVGLNVGIRKDIILSSYQWVLGEVLSQLIKNSLTHGFLEIAHPCITLNIQQREGQVEINYADNGCGSENVDKIFEPFYTTKRGSDCTGLGLPIVYNQVLYKLLGSITCRIDNSQGLAFSIQIPINLTLEEDSLKVLTWAV